MKKQSSSQASWALLSQGVNEARVEAHKVGVFVNQIVSAVKGSEIEDEVYELIGDALMGLPKSLIVLEQSLDRTNYALIKLGDNFYRQRLSQDDRETVDIAARYNAIPSGAKRIANLYIEKNKRG